MNTTAALINYMSSRLLEVAELNSVLDQFGDSKPLPANAKTVNFVREAGWKLPYKAIITNSDWIRVLRNDACGTGQYDFGGFDFDDAAGVLETRELTPRDRAELEALELF